MHTMQPPIPKNTMIPNTEIINIIRVLVLLSTMATVGEAVGLDETETELEQKGSINEFIITMHSVSILSWM